MSVLLVGVAGFFLAINADILAVAVLGILVGALLRDIGWFIGVTNAWSTVALILDWHKIEQILNGTLFDAAPPGTKPECESTGITDLSRRSVK
jgi:hypothetical protein